MIDEPGGDFRRAGDVKWDVHVIIRSLAPGRK